jgi:hypothetical protein
MSGVVNTTSPIRRRRTRRIFIADRRGRPFEVVLSDDYPRP